MKKIKISKKDPYATLNQSVFIISNTDLKEDFRKKCFKEKCESILSSFQLSFLSDADSERMDEEWIILKIY